MTARYATTQLMKHAPNYDNPNADWWQIDTDPAENTARRAAFSNPTGAFKTLSKWNNSATQQANSLEHFKRVACRVWDGGQRAEPRGFILLDGAALVMSGTTSELTWMLSDHLPFSVRKVRCNNDRLCINFARVDKKEIFTTPQTQTVIHIAPVVSWWSQNTAALQNPLDLRWRQLTPPVATEIELSTLVGLLPTAQKEKAWISIKEKYW